MNKLNNQKKKKIFLNNHPNQAENQTTSSVQRSSRGSKIVVFSFKSLPSWWLASNALSTEILREKNFQWLNSLLRVFVNISCSAKVMKEGLVKTCGENGPWPAEHSVSFTTACMLGWTVWYKHPGPTGPTIQVLHPSHPSLYNFTFLTELSTCMVARNPVLSPSIPEARDAEPLLGGSLPQMPSGGPSLVSL